MNHLSRIEQLVRHPKWSYVKGLLVYPSYKPSQKVRLSYDFLRGDVWCVDIEDEATASYLLCVYVQSGGEVSFEEGRWRTPSHSGAHLGEVLLLSLCDLWGVVE